MLTLQTLFDSLASASNADYGKRKQISNLRDIEIKDEIAHDNN